LATAGETFARAVAAKDSTGLRAVLADTIDFQGMTPRRIVQSLQLGWFHVIRLKT
jgi:hypothetical protein